MAMSIVCLPVVAVGNAGKRGKRHLRLRRELVWHFQVKRLQLLALRAQLAVGVLENEPMRPSGCR